MPPPEQAIAAAKQAAARAAVAEIENGMLVGLGTGSTAAFALPALAERIAAGLRVVAVTTSLATEREARRLGIALRDFADVSAIDLAIDGVDEIDPRLRAIKGAGGAMLREKVVASAAARMIAVADDRKLVAGLGAAPVPLEVLPFATAFVGAAARGLGATAVLRRATDGSPYATDQGNRVLDCAFGAIADPAALTVLLAAIPGMLGHGLFVDEIDALYVAGVDGVDRHERRQPADI